MKKRVLLACYGGGHVQSLIPVAKKLQKQKCVELIVIGFTTARAAFKRAGIMALGYDSLLDESDDKWLELAVDFLPSESHRDVSEAETLAYYAIGLHDLILRYGKEEAFQQFQKFGRKAFLPEGTFKRYLKKINPHLVITSTSPRSELALQYAATSLNIETLAIADLFLQHESDYICSVGYARHITVMAGYVSDFLKAKGYTGVVYITGNPAFDSLKNIDSHNRDKKRKLLGIKKGESLVLWVCPSSPISMIGKPFVQATKMLDFLDSFCKKNKNFRYLVREHPSNSVVGQAVLKQGVLCPSSISIEDCLDVADSVLLETSTVGLQAALVGLPVITVDAGSYPPYAELGLSSDVPYLEQAEQALLKAKKPRLDLLCYPYETNASDQVIDVINGLLKEYKQ